MRLRTALLAVAVLSVIFGLIGGVWRHSRDYQALALLHSREAGRLEELLVADVADASAVLRKVHWHDAVAARYQDDAARPWATFRPVADAAYCRCPSCQAP